MYTEKNVAYLIALLYPCRWLAWETDADDDEV